MSKDQAVDRRIARTRRAIRNALVSLIQEKGFDAATVTDIVDRADINRGTFYLHYKDKIALLEQTEKDVLQDIRQIFLRAFAMHARDADVADRLKRVVIEALHYVNQHAELMRALLGLQGRYSLTLRLRAMVEENLEIGGAVAAGVKDPLVPRKYLLAYVVHAHLGVLQEWLEGGRKESPEELARILLGLSLEGAIRAGGLYTGRVARRSK